MGESFGETWPLCQGVQMLVYTTLENRFGLCNNGDNDMGAGSISTVQRLIPFPIAYSSLLHWIRMKEKYCDDMV